MKFSRRKFPVLLLFSLVFICLTVETKASVFTVTSLNDSGAGSLRQAITDANATPGEHVINFQNGLAGTINLATALPVLSNYITINGPGADLLTVRRNASEAFRIFHITSAVTLNGLTIANGIAPDTGEPKLTVRRGSGIMVQGSLTLNDCRILSNAAVAAIAEGGGIHNTGFLLVRNSDFLNNSAISDGNTAGWQYGSGIYNRGTVIIENSIFSGNTGSSAIFNEAASATITRSSITGNTGGGITTKSFAAGSSFLSVENSTISNNTDAGIRHNGGSTMQLKSNTITANQYYGILGSGCSPSLCLIDNNIAAGNSGLDAAGSFSQNSGYNLIGKGENTNLPNGQNGNIVGTSNAPVIAQLEPLGNYGGRTPTQRLLSTSPAINAGNPADFPATDQRGGARPVGGRPDIGAFEFNLTPHRLLPRGGLNAVYNQTLSAFSDAPEPVFTFAVTDGALPPGISLSPSAFEANSAVLAGTPTAVGTFNFTITATTSGGFTVSATYSLTIQTVVSFVAVRGRILTADGKPVGRARILAVDANGNVVREAFGNPFGFYRFKDLQAGEAYSFRVIAKNRRFAARNVTLGGELNDFDFIAEP